jgi:hypothetical protein
MKSLYALILVLMSGTVYGKSNLPTCKGLDVTKWSNCYGETTIRDFLYKGEFLNGKMHGLGMMVLTNPDFKGGVIVGEFRDGSRDGQGIYINAEGEKFEGIWRGPALIRKTKVNLPSYLTNLLNKPKENVLSIDELLIEMKLLNSIEKTALLLTANKNQSITILQLCYMNAGFQGKLRESTERNLADINLKLFGKKEEEDHKSYWADQTTLVSELLNIPRPELTEILEKSNNEVVEFLLFPNKDKSNLQKINTNRVLDTNLACGNLRFMWTKFMSKTQN